MEEENPWKKEVPNFKVECFEFSEKDGIKANDNHVLVKGKTKCITDEEFDESMLLYSKGETAKGEIATYMNICDENEVVTSSLRDKDGKILAGKFAVGNSEDKNAPVNLGLSGDNLTKHGYISMHTVGDNVVHLENQRMVVKTGNVGMAWFQSEYQCFILGACHSETDKKTYATAVINGRICQVSRSDETKGNDTEYSCVSLDGSLSKLEASHVKNIVNYVLGEAKRIDIVSEEPKVPNS